LKALIVAPGGTATAGVGDSRIGGDAIAPGWRGRSTRIVNAVTSASGHPPMPMPPPAVLASSRVTCPEFALPKLTRTYGQAEPADEPLNS